ncbi:MAG: hypothetical protein GY853_16815 [PVC group bacterium]|nr:hypothetical protein [PVC group bacterium]
MDQKVNELELNGVKYIREDSIKREQIVFTGEKTIATTMIGKPVIVRSSNEGVNAGIVELADETGVVLVNVRRLHYHKPKDKSLSWYEGVAESGISEDSIVSGTVTRKVIVEKYSMTEIKNIDFFNEILKLTPNAQS